MVKTIRTWIARLLAIGILVLIVLAVVGVIAVACGTVLEWLGLRYDSVGQLLLYVLYSALLGLPLDLFSTASVRALYRLRKVDRRQGNLLYIPMDTLFTVAAFWLVDRWMDSVSATGLSLWVLGLGMALATLPIPKRG